MLIIKHPSYGEMKVQQMKRSGPSRKKKGAIGLKMIIVEKVTDASPSNDPPAKGFCSRLIDFMIWKRVELIEKKAGGNRRKGEKFCVVICCRPRKKCYGNRCRRKFFCRTLMINTLLGGLCRVTINSIHGSFFLGILTNQILWVNYSTVTDLARLRGWSMSVPRSLAI